MTKAPARTAAASLAAAAAAASAAPTAPQSLPSMGETVIVTARPGALLRNVETGGFFEPGVPTPQTVTTTLLRRLVDGDLVLQAGAASAAQAHQSVPVGLEK